MKVLIANIAVGLFMFSCSSKKEIASVAKTDELRHYFIHSILKDSTVKVDSFRVVRIDTLSAKNGYTFMYNKILTIIDNNHYEFDGAKEDLEKAKRDYRLMVDNPYAGNLLAIYKDNFDKAVQKMKDITHEDSLYFEDIKRLDTILMKCDSVKPIALLAKCFYQLKNKDYSTEKDTANIILDNQFNIISQEEYLKRLPVFLPVSNVSFKR